MSDARGCDWSLYASDMAIFAENVLQYTAGMTQSQFVADRKTFDVTVRNLKLIGKLQAGFPSQ